MHLDHSRFLVSPVALKFLFASSLLAVQILLPNVSVQPATISARSQLLVTIALAATFFARTIITVHEYVIVVVIVTTVETTLNLFIVTIAYSMPGTSIYLITAKIMLLNFACARFTISYWPGLAGL